MMKAIVRWGSVVLSCLAVMLSAFAIAQQDDSEIKGAVCVIRSGERVVMIDEIITKKLSLPGGGVTAGENPKMAAEREVWEETGLVVSANKELARVDNAIIYDCVSDSDIIAFQYNNALDGNVLPSWFAPHYGVEVASAMLIDPRQVSPSRYRFPGQLEWLRGAVLLASDQPTLYIADMIEAAPFWHKFELKWLVELQHSLHKLPQSLHLFAESFILLGLWFANPITAMILVPAIFWRCGTQFGYRLIFALTTTSLLVLIAQQGFALPGPQAYLPEVAKRASYGFGLPSLTAALWACAGILVLQAKNGLALNRASGLLGLVLVWGIIANYYSGASFIIDGLSGALFGALCAWHLIRLELKPEIDLSNLIASRTVWLVLLVVSAITTLVWPIPVFTYWLAAILTILAVIMTWKQEPEMTWVSMLTTVLLLLVTNFVVSSMAEQTSSSGLASLIVEALRYPLLIVLFTLMVRTTAKAK